MLPGSATKDVSGVYITQISPGAPKTDLANNQPNYGGSTRGVLGGDPLTNYYRGVTARITMWNSANNITLGKKSAIRRSVHIAQSSGSGVAFVTASVPLAKLVPIR